jgi:hypothetical protein
VVHARCLGKAWVVNGNGLGCASRGPYKSGIPSSPTRTPGAHPPQVRDFITTTGSENLGKRLVNNKEKVEFEKPNMTMDILMKYGRALVQEQENVKRVQLADAYLSGAALAGESGSSMPEGFSRELDGGVVAGVAIAGVAVVGGHDAAAADTPAPLCSPRVAHRRALSGSPMRLHEARGSCNSWRFAWRRAGWGQGRKCAQDL